MSGYFICLNGQDHSEAEDLTVAITRAEMILQQCDPKTPGTVSVQNRDGYLLAALSTGRIIGRFLQQQWEGPKHDYATPCGNVAFDATDEILLMTHHELIALQDNDESTDTIGRNYVAWDGPCSVDITESICAFFGVFDIEDITPEALTYARNRLNPQPPTELVLPLTLTLTLKVQPSAHVTNILHTLNCNMTSSTPGIVITNLHLAKAS